MPAGGGGRRLSRGPKPRQGQGAGGAARRSTLSGQGHAGTSRERAFPWFPTWAFPWEDDSTSPPRTRPGALGGQRNRTGCLHPTDSRGRRGGGGLPPALGSIPKTSERPFCRGSGPGRDGGWERRGRAGAGGQGRPPQTSAGSPGLGGTDSSMSVLHTHTPGGEPGPSCGDRESWRPPPVPGDQAAEGPGPPDLRCPCPPSHLFWGHASPRAAHYPPE